MKGSTKLVYVISLLVLIPFLLLLLFSPEYYDVRTLGGLALVIGKSLALSGFSLMCVNLILSAKLKVVDRWFGGLDRVVAVHRRVGVVAFTLILLHPFFLSLRYLDVSFEVFTDFVFSFSPTYLLLGKLAITLFVIVIGFTLFVSRKNIKYEVLKSIHRLMGIVLVLGMFHALLTGSDIFSVKAVNIYYVVLFFTALAVYINRSIFNNYFGKRYKYEVGDVKRLSEKITQVALCPKGEKMHHRGGQFQFITIKQDGFPYETHPFTISSGSNEDCIRLSIETYGDFTTQIPNLKVGATAIIDGPYGGFTLNKALKKDIVMFAGNIGITPLLSMVRSLGGYPWGYKIHLLHSVSDNGFSVFEKELREVEKQNEGFKFELWDTSKKGRIELEHLKSMAVDWKTFSVFICGSAGFNKSMIENCKELGVDPNDIHYEEFKLL